MTKTATKAKSETLAGADAAGMVDYLENILMRHLERLRNYDLDGAMALAEESYDLALTIGRAGTLDEPAFAAQRGRIHQLYREISLVIASERQEVSEKLKAIRKGLKALGAYRNR